MIAGVCGRGRDMRPDGRGAKPLTRVLRGEVAFLDTMPRGFGEAAKGRYLSSKITRTEYRLRATGRVFPATLRRLNRDGRRRV